MKLRIKGNSIRLRLGRSEVRRLAIDGTLEEVTVFGLEKGQRFGYAICVVPEPGELSANFADGRIVICVPSGKVLQWATTDQVSIEGIQRIGKDGELLMLIEKDFECVEPSMSESQEDAFPHPTAAACQLAQAIERSK